MGLPTQIPGGRHPGSLSAHHQAEVGTQYVKAIILLNTKPFIHVWYHYLWKYYGLFLLCAGQLQIGLFLGDKILCDLTTWHDP